MKQVARSHRGEDTRDNHSVLYCHMSDMGWEKKEAYGVMKKCRFSKCVLLCSLIIEQKVRLHFHWDRTTLQLHECWDWFLQRFGGQRGADPSGPLELGHKSGM